MTLTETLRMVILVCGWPILVVGSLVVLRGAIVFNRRVRRSAIGRLVLVMITGWLVSMYSLGATATAFMLRDAEHGVPVVLPVFIAWAVTMVGITYAVWKWSKEVVNLNALQSDLERLVDERTHALAASLEREHQLEKARVELLSIVAHDMVQPLSTIALEVHMMKQPRPGEAPTAGTQLDRIERSLTYLRKLVGDVRDLGRMQAGRLTLSVVEVDLALLVRAAVGSFESRAADKDVRIELDMDEDVRVRADPHRLSQVLFNLLSNALKFTPANGLISVIVRTGDVDAVVQVRDSGRGLDQADMARLFEPFSPGRALAGFGQTSGLGLYICKGIIEQHGGRIWGESPGLGQGTLFTFAIPRLATFPTPVAVVAPVARP